MRFGGKFTVAKSWQQQFQQRRHQQFEEMLISKLTRLLESPTSSARNTKAKNKIEHHFERIESYLDRGKDIITYETNVQNEEKRERVILKKDVWVGKMTVRGDRRYGTRWKK